jgi:chemotaxis protein MotA
MVTTFYGAFVANMFYLPMAGKLETRSKEETLIREMTIQGLLALVDGESPKVIETRLLAFLSPKSRLQSAA